MLIRQRLDDAGALRPLRLRSLDAIHLVAAQRVGDTLRAVVSYDARMLSAAADLGMVTASPSQSAQAIHVYDAITKTTNATARNA